MRISDVIEDFIKDMLEDDDLAIIQRNDLAEHFNCVPSQINYVISTRFTPMQGYYVESSRGGGGCIKIRKVNELKIEKYENCALSFQVLSLWGLAEGFFENCSRTREKGS